LIPTEPVPSKSAPVAEFVVTGSYGPKATVDVDETMHFAATDALILNPTPGELAAKSGLAVTTKVPAASADK
jgi:hypothetical protein